MFQKTCYKNLGPDCTVVPPVQRYREISVPKDVHIKYNEGQLREIFKRHDINGDGVLSKQELRSAFYSLGACIPRFSAHQARRHADSNGDGYIDEAELENLVRYAVDQGYIIK